MFCSQMSHACTLQYVSLYYRNVTQILRCDRLYRLIRSITIRNRVFIKKKKETKVTQLTRHDDVKYRFCLTLLKHTNKSVNCVRPAGRQLPTYDLYERGRGAWVHDTYKKNEGVAFGSIPKEEHEDCILVHEELSFSIPGREKCFRLCNRHPHSPRRTLHPQTVSSLSMHLFLFLFLSLSFFISFSFSRSKPGVRSIRIYAHKGSPVFEQLFLMGPEWGKEEKKTNAAAWIDKRVKLFFPFLPLSIS